MRKYITIFIAAFFIGTIVFCYAGQSGYNLTSNNYFPAGKSIGNIDMNSYYMSGINYLKYITNGYLGTIARTTDAAPYMNTIDGSDAYAKATAGTNSTGGITAISAGIGATYTTITGYASSATDTLTVYVINSAGTLETTVKTADGASWPLCSATSNAACALALKNSAAISGVTMSCTDGTCSDAKVFFQPDATTKALHMVAANVGGAPVYGTVTMGAMGDLRLYGNGIKVCSSYGTSCGEIRAANYPDTKGLIIFTGASFTGAEAVMIENSAENATAPLYASVLYASSRTQSGANSTMTQGTMTIKASTLTVRTETVRTKACTFAGGGGGATCVTSGLLLAGEHLEAVVGKVTTAGAGCTSISAGDGTDPDRYAASFTIASSSFTPAIATASFGHDIITAEEVTITSTAGGNCVGTVVSITAWITQYSVPTY